MTRPANGDARSGAAPAIVVAVAFGVAVAMIAGQIASKAVRDAFFLSVYQPEILARVMTASSIVSVVAVLGVMRLYTRFAPRRLVPFLFTTSAALFGLEWLLIASAQQKLAALVLFLHTSSFGAISISGFWAVMNERFDPHTAKRVIARLASGATLGGLIGGVAVWQAADAVPISSMLLVLALLNIGCAFGIRIIVGERHRSKPTRDASKGNAVRPPTKARTAPWHLFEDSPYLAQVALLVIVVAFGTAGVDYVFKATAAASYSDERGLVSFFALFYLFTGVAAFVVQNLVANKLLGRLGIAATVATLPFALLLLGPVALFVPGLFSMALLRGGASTIESSTYRSAYELLYTPLAPEAKRPAKTLIDVGGDKLGSALGAACAVFLVGLVPGAATSLLLLVALVCGLIGVGLSRRLARGYVDTLAARLRSGLLAPDSVGSGGVLDPASRDLVEKTSVAVKSLASSERLAPRTPRLSSSPAPLFDFDAPGELAGADRRTKLLFALDSDEPAALAWALRQTQSLPRTWLPHLIEQLGNPQIGALIEKRLRQGAPSFLGALVDGLFDSSTALSARLAIARILSAVPTQRCASSLINALRLEPLPLRVAVARSLEMIRAKNASIVVGSAAVFELAKEEAILLNRFRFESSGATVEDRSVNSPASLGVAYCVLLVSLVVDRRALRLALTALTAENSDQRGTGLEYIETVFPDELKAALAPWLVVPEIADQALRAIDGKETAKAPTKLSLAELTVRLDEYRERQNAR